MSGDKERVQVKMHARVDKFTSEQIEACRIALNLDREPNGPELIAFCAAAESIETED